MPQSGLYIVTLRNREPISVNAHDKRIAHNCISVTYENCKFGKAKALERRKRNYDKTFGSHNVDFHLVAELSDIELAERKVLDKLQKYRVIGRTGCKNEWLEKITPQELLAIIIATLRELEIDFVPLVNKFSSHRAD